MGWINTVSIIIILKNCNVHSAIVIEHCTLQEDGAGSDLDDAAMFKLDEALSAVFRSMVKNKKNSKEEKDRKQQIKNFKLK